MKLGNVITINPESIEEGYPFDVIEYIEISSVGTGTLEKTRCIQLDAAPSRAKRIVKKDDILLATVRPNLRSFWYAKNPKKNMIASTGFAVLRAREKIDSRFLYYTVTNQPFTDYLTANAKGAAYPAVDTEIIKRAEISLPTLPIQRNIAAILSAYDDLIENNLRRIKILEEMAQALYREWFVHFRFPGHEKVRLIDSPMGKIPEGWEVKELKDVCHLIMGQSPKSKYYNTDKLGLPFHQGV
ncbi:MAG: restriction endonuclease subunit S, partial [Dethiobacteria bacterium]